MSISGGRGPALDLYDVAATWKALSLLRLDCPSLPRPEGDDLLMERLIREDVEDPVSWTLATSELGSALTHVVGLASDKPGALRRADRCAELIGVFVEPGSEMTLTLGAGEDAEEVSYRFVDRGRFLRTRVPLLREITGTPLSPGVPLPVAKSA